MTKLEFETKIKEENLIQIHDGMKTKNYIQAEKIFNETGKWIQNVVDVYGCYYNPITNKAQ